MGYYGWIENGGNGTRVKVVHGSWKKGVRRKNVWKKGFRGRGLEESGLEEGGLDEGGLEEGGLEEGGLGGWRKRRGGEGSVYAMNKGKKALLVMARGIYRIH